tara:strand:+ start:350 stop:703 length:354 start_codon:yes stop_codon:yes gene_type:complete
MVKIKDSITGKITEFSWDYYKKGVLMASSKQKKSKILAIDVVNRKILNNKDKIEQELGKDLWDCPQCGRHTMEEVYFSMGSAAPDGEPGLLCFHCHYMLAGERLHDYMRDEDDRRDQ